MIADVFRDPFDIDNYAQDPAAYLAVPFVPTEEDTVEAMLSLAGVGPADRLYDLGSGDGRIVIAAARDRGARGVGVDIDPVRVADAREQAEWAEVQDLVDFVEDDLFAVDIRSATVVSLYLLQSINVELRPRLLEQLKPGARIVSHAFDMGDWQADERIKVADGQIYKWTIPARVAGRWDWTRADGTPVRLELQQTYQRVSGRAWLGEVEAGLAADLCGERLEVELQPSEGASVERFLLTFAGGALTSVAED